MSEPNPITAQWDLISQDYLEAPSTYGIITKLAEKYQVDYDSLKMRIWKSGLKQEREELKNKLPIKAKMREALSTALATEAIKPRDIQKKIQEAYEDHQEFATKITSQLRSNFKTFVDAEPFEFERQIKTLDSLDAVTRKMFGMSSQEDIDPHKRGIALLAYGYNPPDAKQADARVVG